METSSQPAEVAAAGGDDLGGAGEGGEALRPGRPADELEEAVAHARRVLEALLGGELLEPAAEQLGARAGVAGEDGAALGDDDGVVALGLGPGARGAAAAHVGERAGGAAAGEAAGALAQRDDLVDGVDGGLGRGPGPERADVVGVVVADLLDDGQAREALLGELDPHDLAAVLGPPVEAWLVLVDEPQLAHLRLERGLADDRVDDVGEPHHLGHPAALLGGREVGAHAGADVAARADVEDAVVAVLEEVDAGCARQRVGEEALASLRRA